MSQQYAPRKLKISGILAYPGISRNGNLYTAKELEHGDGVKVPFYDEHEDFEEDADGHPTGRILNLQPSGALNLHWNDDLQQLEYDGWVSSPRTINRIKNGINKVSLAAEPAYFEPGPDGTRVPRGLRFFSASDVEKPGLPLTTLNMAESFRPKIMEYVVEGVNLTVPDHVRGIVLLESETFITSGDLDDASREECDTVPKHDAEESHEPGETPDEAPNATSTKLTTPYEKELNSAARGRLANKTFAVPPKGDEEDGKLPLNDASHVANAIARFNQTHFSSPEEKNTARAKIRAAAKKFGVEIGPDSPVAEESEAFGSWPGAGDSGTNPATTNLFHKNQDPTQPGYGLSTNAGSGVMSDYGTVATRQEPQAPQGVANQKANFQDPTRGLADSTRGDGRIASAVPDLGTPQVPATGPFVSTMPYKGGQLARPIQALLNNAGQTGERFVRKIRESARANKSPKARSRPMATRLKEDSGEAEPAQDSSVKQAAEVADAPARATNAGPQFTPYEKLLNKVSSGNASIQEMQKFAQMTKKLKEEDLRSDSFKGSQPGGMSPGMRSVNHPIDGNPIDEEEEDSTPADELAGKEAREEEEAGEIPVQKGPASSAANPSADGRGRMAVAVPTQEEEEEEEMRESLGYTRQEWRKLPVSERAAARRKYRMERLAESGVKNPISIAKARESRAFGEDVNQQVVRAQLGESAVKIGFGDQVFVPKGRTWAPMTYESALDEMFRIASGESNRDSFRMMVPTFKPPTMGIEGQGLREFNLAFESYRNSRIESLSKGTRYVKEAISPSTTGFASGTEAMTPALVIPSQLPGLSRETVLFTPLPQGYKQHEFQMTTASTFSATSYNTDPGSTDPTLTAVNITTAEYAVEHQIAFSAERKGIGPQLDAFILGDRLGALYLDDQIVFGTVGSGGIEAATIQSSNKYFGDGTVTAESSITSSMTMAYKALSTVINTGITASGYSPDNLVCFMHPKPFNDLLNDSSIVRFLQNPVASGDYRDALIARGVIPLLNGSEIRRSTLVKTGTGSPSTVTTYHTYVYKKGLSVAMAASRDLMIETFRDIKLNSTFTKSHIDYGAQVLHPNSIGVIYTA